MPAIDTPDDQVNEFLHPVIQLCGDFWCLLLEQMTRTSSAPKAGRALVIAIVNEIVAAAWQAEWPGAQILLYVLCNHLKDVVHGGPSRTGKADASAREERELLLEVVGHLIAQVCLYDMLCNVSLIIGCSVCGWCASMHRVCHGSESDSLNVVVSEHTKVGQTLPHIGQNTKAHRHTSAWRHVAEPHRFYEVELTGHRTPV